MMKIHYSWLIGSAFLAFASISCVHANTKLLVNYNQLLQALDQGDDVRAILYLDKCTLKKSGNTKILNSKLDTERASMRMNFNIYSHYKVKVDAQHERYAIATSNTILTEHRDFGPVYAYGRLRIFGDNSAEFHAAYYHPQTYELKGEADYLCQISNDSDQNAIDLFDSSR
ncbi:MAG: hypothetical protein KIT56_08950 [Gammaproteobacteria bacterium]|nr:hypothetical protein [Gammaproteobacteria bacterium]MCW5583984.1 hypothetical protein [Gammaproteobacteria bacterium]